MKYLIAALLIASTVASYAQTIVVPFGPGSLLDLTARKYGEQLNLPVENKPGGNGMIAARAADNLMLAAVPLQTASESKFFEKFHPIAPAFTMGLVAAVNNGSGDVASFLVSVSGKRVNIGVTGAVGGLSANILNKKTNLNAAVVQFRNHADLATALLRGDVDLIFTDYAVARDRFSIIASTGTRVAYPGVKTFEAQGILDLSLPSIVFMAINKEARNSQLELAVEQASRSSGIEELTKRFYIVRHYGNAVEQYIKFVADGFNKLAKEYE